MANSVLGVDIGSASIKLVELMQSGKDRWQLLTAASISTPVGGVMANPGNAAAVSQLITKLIKEIGVKTKKAVVGLPEEQVSSHVVEIPMMKEDEVRHALEWQVEQYIPIPADKAVWSHQVLKREQTGSTMEVMLVAAAKNLVATYTSVLEQAGLEVVAVETELTATARAVSNPDLPLFIVADIGAGGTDIGIVNNGQLVFARTIPTGGNAFTRAIETGLNLDTPTAEQYKNTYGFRADSLKGELVKVLIPVVTVIGEEIRKTADFYTSKHPGEQIRMAVLSGGVATLPEMVGTLSGMTGIEVVLGNPLSKLQMNSRQAKSMEGTAPIYTVALGLAMRRD